MKRLSVLLAGSALAVSANAVNWSKVSESPTGSIFSVDLNSIESSDISVIDEKPMDNITVSIRRTYPTQKDSAQKNEDKDGTATKETKVNKDKASKDTALHHSDQQLLISCKDASYYKRAYVNYGADNKVIKSWQSEKPILTTKDFVVTTPKTIGRLIVDQACKSYQDGQKSI